MNKHFPVWSCEFRDYFHMRKLNSAVFEQEQQQQ